MIDMSGRQVLIDDCPYDCEDWLKKCIHCKHARMYTETSEVYCNLKKPECRFEPWPDHHEGEKECLKKRK